MFPGSLHPILAALAGPEGPAATRLVGGAVRALLKDTFTPQTDLDLATVLPPETTLARLKQAGIRTDDSGTRWGCVTALPEGLPPVEITTLRHDSYLPGSRYPTVTFTTDWQQDAHRRDFTLNAIYLSPDETWFDPFNGREDLAANMVVFIGDPATRLSEDPLRLLRFFRFCGEYGLGGLTADVRAALENAAPAVKTLSRKRIAQEIHKLEQTPHAAKVINQMKHLHIWELLPPAAE